MIEHHADWCCAQAGLNTDDKAIDEARRMFARTLSAWAMDLLSLRTRGFDRPTALGEVGLVARPVHLSTK